MTTTGNGSYYTFLGVPGTRSTHATGVNNAGQVVGYFDQDNASPYQGFVYSGGAYTVIDNPLGYQTHAYGINDVGQIVGSYDVSGPTQHGFIYSGRTYTTLDDPLASGGITIATGINNSGQVVGYYFDGNPASGFNYSVHGFLYSGGTYITLDDPLAARVTVNGRISPQQTYAEGINDSGEIAGYYIDNHGDPQPFVYSGGTYTTLTSPAVNHGYALDINDAGQIVGRYFDSSSIKHDFVYDNGVFNVFNPFPSAYNAAAQGINDNGKIVGDYTGSPTDNALGYLWHAAPQFGAPTYELAYFGVGAGGWSNDNLYPRELADVNGDGMADIVGFGYRGVNVSLATGGGHFAQPIFALANFGVGAGGWMNNDQYPRELADVNGDGMADIVGFGKGGVNVSLATGNGHFAQPTSELANFGVGAGGWMNNNQYPRELADVNGDGMADIVGFGNGGVNVALATGNGHFAQPTYELNAFGVGAGGWSSDNQYPRELADVNGDGMADIVGFSNSGVNVSLATGGGHFAQPVFELANFGVGAGGWTNNDQYPRELADVNGDGMADIVGFGNGGVVVAFATGGGHFAQPTYELNAFGVGAGGWTNNDQYPRELGDVNGDHRADIVGFGHGGVNVSLVHDFLI